MIHADLDDADLRLLELLQLDASLSQAQLAERAGMSTTSCWRRIQRLEASGVIRRRVALLDPAALGLGVHVVVQVSLTEHSPRTARAFEALVAKCPEVVECYSMSGERDYMLRVIVRDIAAYDDFLTRTLLHHPVVASASSSFALRQIKYETALPIGAPRASRRGR